MEVVKYHDTNLHRIKIKKKKIKKMRRFIHIYDAIAINMLYLKIKMLVNDKDDEVLEIYCVYDAANSSFVSYFFITCSLYIYIRV